MNLEEEEVNSLAQIFGYKKGALPITYLGVPLHHNKLRKEDLQPVIDKVIKRVAGWRGRLLSYGGRIILVWWACLANITRYLLSVIKFPSWAIHAINFQMAHCLWDNYEDHHKYHLANWEMMAMKKGFGGLGIPNLRDHLNNLAKKLVHDIAEVIILTTKFFFSLNHIVARKTDKSFHSACATTQTKNKW